MEQDVNNTFEYVNNEQKKSIENNNNTNQVPIMDDNQNLAQDFVTGLPSWDLEPPYEVIRRVKR